jgi:F0F1-type ATP synthase assembly protein I
VSEAARSVLSAWESFYVIVGSSGAALTGLMFVVIALVAETPRRSTSEIDTFGTPTIVHFCAALLVAAIISAPWRSLANVALTIGALGVCGIVYTTIVIRRARRQTGYRPVFEDWLWHGILPFIAYATFLSAAIALTRAAESSLFAIGAVTLLLLFIGIHNAWDTVTFIATVMRAPNDEPAPPAEGSTRGQHAQTASLEAGSARP